MRDRDIEEEVDYLRNRIEQLAKSASRRGQGASPMRNNSQKLTNFGLSPHQTGYIGNSQLGYIEPIVPHNREYALRYGG